MDNQGAVADSKSKASKKANPPRKHHYVPVFYQQNFVNDRGFLWIYDRQLETYKEFHPRVICFERDLYTLKPRGKPHDAQIETRLLSFVDRIGCDGIIAFKSGRPNPEA